MRAWRRPLNTKGRLDGGPSKGLVVADWRLGARRLLLTQGVRLLAEAGGFLDERLLLGRVLLEESLRPKEQALVDERVDVVGLHLQGFVDLGQPALNVVPLLIFLQCRVAERFVP